MRKECWENLTTIKGKKERGKQLATYLTCFCEWAAERGGTGRKGGIWETGVGRMAEQGKY